MFYRALGVGLAQIKQLLDDPAFDCMAALRGHLTALSAERDRIDGLIHTVRRTLDAEERKEFMHDHEKFEAFKQRAVSGNEAAHGAEIRARYGDASMDAANARVLALTPEEYDAWKQLGDDIRARLTAAVRARRIARTPRRAKPSPHYTGSGWAFPGNPTPQPHTAALYSCTRLTNGSAPIMTARRPTVRSFCATRYFAGFPADLLPHTSPLCADTPPLRPHAAANLPKNRATTGQMPVFAQ